MLIFGGAIKNPMRC